MRGRPFGGKGPLNGERAGPAGSPPAGFQGKLNLRDADPKVVEYIREAARKRGIDPNTALAVSDGEGLRNFSPDKPVVGDGGTSHGPFQMHYAGGFGRNRQPGLGDDFTRETGLDARDPKTWQRQVDFSLDHAAKNGWGAWYGRQHHGVGKWDGISGFSKAELTQRASAEAGTGQFRGYKVDAIAKRVLQPLGLDFRVENGPDGWDTTFPNVIVRNGESPFDLVSRLCRQRGLWLRADPSGDVVAGSKPDGGRAMFEEGVNILSGNCSQNWVQAQSVVADSQIPGSDNLFGRKAAEIQAKSTIQGGDGQGSRKVLAEMPLAQKELQLRTDMEVMAIQAALLRVSLSYQGWLNPNGELWALTDFVTVKSPSLFPIIEENKLDLKLWAYTYGQTPEGQTTTAIELVNKAAFAIKNPDGQQSDPFNNPATPAQPEALT